MKKQQLNIHVMKNSIALIEAFIMATLVTIVPPLLAATPYTQVAEVFPSDPLDNQFFGLAAAISDGVAVVGAPINPASGAAYVYAKTDAGWVFQQKLEASDGPGQAGFNQFGWAVAVAGDTVAVAAPRRVRDGKFGAVYVFTRSATGTTWTEQAIITSSTSRPFGQSVALRGGTLVVGALEDRLSFGGLADSGLAFVFRRSGDEWIEEASLMSSDIPDRNRWGVSVDIRGNTAVVAAGEDPSASGPVYIFSRQGNTWTQDTKLSPGGQSVSLWGATLAVGGPGAVSIYEHVGQNWQLQQTLPGGSGEEFVALREDRLLIGEHRAAGTVGVARLYGFDEESGQWTLNQTLSPVDGQAGDLYGVAVSLSSTAAIITAPRHFHSPNPQSGAAYIYEP
jgi:hypothetical protein